MKKIFITIMTICLLVSAFGTTAFAAELSKGKSMRFGSIFGEGSLPMIISLLALIISCVSMFLTVYYNKKKESPANASNAEEVEDEE